LPAAAQGGAIGDAYAYSATAQTDIPGDGFLLRFTIGTVGQTVISYRGTDNVPVDAVIGWPTGVGLYTSSQAEDACYFTRPKMAIAFAPNSNIILTGHSLSGGLAGFVGEIYGVQAVMFDNSPFDDDKDGGRQRIQVVFLPWTKGGTVMGEVSFDYSIRATRTVHLESPSRIGERLIYTLDALSRSNPSIFVNWEIADYPTKSLVSLAAARSCIGAIVENNISRDDWGEPHPSYGYSVMAHTGGVATQRRVTLWIIAGGKNPGHIWLQTGFWQVPPDPSIVTYPIFKGALLALVANWSLPSISAHASRSNTAMVPVHGGAGYLLESRPMLPQEPTFPRSPFEIPWIGYLSADLAAGVKLSPEIATEHAADGGLLMITTEDRLDPDNPEHLRRARIIAETMIACTGYESDGTARA
jgi:hypothetical protein